MTEFAYNSLWGLLILVSDIVAVVNIFQSPVSNGKKFLWLIAVVVLPLLGLILWYFPAPWGR